MKMRANALILAESVSVKNSVLRDISRDVLLLICVTDFNSLILHFLSYMITLIDIAI